MTTYLSPGIYVKEVSSGIFSIAGVGTSTAGFIGIIKPQDSSSQADSSEPQQINLVDKSGQLIKGTGSKDVNFPAPALVSDDIEKSYKFLNEASPLQAAGYQNQKRRSC